MEDVVYYLPRLIKKLKPVSKRNSVIDKTAKVEGGTQIIDSFMGKYSFCGYDCVIVNTKIGSFCSLASNIKIGLASHPLDWVSTSCAFYYGRDSIRKNLASLEYADHNPQTWIGNDVWIAENVLIKAGIHIADGAVIGMGSILTHDVGPYEIWAGNPARFIRKRFNDEIIERLLDTKWWDLPNDVLSSITGNMNNLNSFIDKSNQVKQRK